MPENLLASDWLAKGLVLADSKEYEKAVMAFNQAIGAFPQCAEAWEKKGEALFVWGCMRRP